MRGCSAASSCCCLTVAQLVQWHYDPSQTALEVLLHSKSYLRLSGNTYLQCTARCTNLLLMHEGQASLEKVDVWFQDKKWFCCSDSSQWRKCMHSPIAAICKDILQFYIKGPCVLITLSSPILYHLLQCGKSSIEIIASSAWLVSHFPVGYREGTCS